MCRALVMLRIIVLLCVTECVCVCPVRACMDSLWSAGVHMHHFPPSFLSSPVFLFSSEFILCYLAPSHFLLIPLYSFALFLLLLCCLTAPNPLPLLSTILQSFLALLFLYWCLLSPSLHSSVNRFSLDLSSTKDQCPVEYTHTQTPDRELQAMAP